MKSKRKIKPSHLQIVLVLGFSTILLSIIGSCGNNPTSSPKPIAQPTPTATSTAVIQGHFSMAVTGAAGGEEFAYEMVDFTACGACTTASLFFPAPCTMQLSGAIAPFASNQMLTSWDSINTIQFSIPYTPVTLGQSVTWIAAFVIPTVDVNEAFTNGMAGVGVTPGDELDYNFASNFSQDMKWVLNGYVDYNIPGTSIGSILVQGGLISPYLNTFNEVQAPQTLILSVPVTLP